jgi:Leucine-rich repeat (LRR) protein
LPSDFTVDLFWQRRSLFAVPAQLWLNPAYDGLCGLYLDRNSITHLPEECAKFTSLLALSISDNQLKDIPEWIGSLPRLRTLAAPRNQISGLPHALGKLKTLENLNVFGNRIERLPIQLGNCEMLVEFNVRNNPLVTLNSEEEAGFTLDLAVPVASLDLIKQGHNEKAIRQLLPFWQRRLEEYAAEMNRLEETREDRERAVMLAQQVLDSKSRLSGHNMRYRIALQLLPLLTSRDRRRSVLAGNAICSLWIPSHARFHCLADFLCLVLLSAAVRPPC